jgi:molybdate transport system regulatory protein
MLEPESSGGERDTMRLSTRNQLAATVQEVTEGNVMATVKVALGDGQSVTAAITREAVEDLELVVGDRVTVLVKATEVMLAKD